MTTLADMRSDFREALGDRASDYSDPQVDARLNRIWQNGLPDKVPDLFGVEKVTGITTTASSESLDLSAKTYRIRDLKSPIYINGNVVALWDDATVFWQLYDVDDTTEGAPLAALQVGRAKLILRPIPDQSYNVIVHALRFNAALTAAGLTNEALVDATVRGAVVREASQQGYDSIVARFAPLFAESLSQLRGQAAGKAKSALVVADF